ncbi:hypothetical protein VPH35_038528 [Triticum aestivum]
MVARSILSPRTQAPHLFLSRFLSPFSILKAKSPFLFTSLGAAAPCCLAATSDGAGRGALLCPEPPPAGQPVATPPWSSPPPTTSSSASFSSASIPSATAGSTLEERPDPPPPASPAVGSRTTERIACSFAAWGTQLPRPSLPGKPSSSISMSNSSGGSMGRRGSKIPSLFIFLLSLFCFLRDVPLLPS